jgi:hypothetical protein
MFANRLLDHIVLQSSFMVVAVLALFVSMLDLPARAVEEDPTDRQDQAILDRTLYGPMRLEDFDERQAEEMVGAADRMVARRKRRVERQQRLVDEGVAPRLSVAEQMEELERARRVLALAQGRADLVRELAESARIETQELPGPLVEKFEGASVFARADLVAIRREFEEEFGSILPISANGDTRFHRALGFNHRGRVDIALDPDQPEGVWLRGLLQKKRIPYFAFRAAVRGKASGRHIHIGPPSERISRGD